MRKTLLCLLVLGSSACGGGGGGAIGFGDFPDALESADCDFEVECGLMPDVGTCQDALAFDDGEIGSLQVAIDAGTVVYDADAAGACVDSVRNQGCAFPGFHVDDPCVDVFAGTVAQGGACNIDAECSGNALCEATDPACDPTVACCPGTCGASTEPQPIGGTCEGSADCGDDAFCNFPAGQQTGTCAALITEQGASCNDFFACANPMICEITDFQNFIGTCEIPADREATCDPNRLIPCTDLRDFCDPTAATCTPTIDVGGACDDDAGVFCVGFASCLNLTCTADPGLGEACPVDGSQACLGSLGCDAGTCALGPSSPVCPQ